MHDGSEAHSPQPRRQADTHDSGRLATLGDRLSYLFDKIHPVGRERFTYREVAAEIQRRFDVEISAAYIHQLCTGARTNPKLSPLQGLARFFGVPVGFLAGDGDLDPIAQQIEHLSTAIAEKELLLQFEQVMRDPSARVVALKLRGVSEPHLGLVSTLVDQVRRLEGLPHAETSDEHAPSTNPGHPPSQG